MADTLRFFKKDEYDLPSETGVCSYVNFKTLKQSYKAILTFTDNINDKNGIFISSDGGYIIWVRCCRNRGVNNVSNSEEVGILLYTEFPPLNIINSSPVFDTPAKTVYGCLGIEQNYSFAANDADKDEIRYTLEVPYVGVTTSQLPDGVTKAAPYDFVPLEKGFTTSNIIPSNPALNFDTATGQLKFTPTQSGLFVLRIKASEYRNGTYLGQVNRDYQIIASSCFTANTKPELKIWHNNSYTNQTTSKQFNSNKNVCYNIITLDTIQGQILNLSLSKTVAGWSLTPQRYSTKKQNDTAYFKLCYDKCVKNDVSLYDLDLKLENSNNCSNPNFAILKTKITKNNVEQSPPLILVPPEYRAGTTYTVDDTLNLDFGFISPDSNVILANGNSANGYLPSLTSKNNLKTSLNLKHTFSCLDFFSSPNKYTFKAIDSACGLAKETTLELELKVKDKKFDIKTKIPNIITPNDDGINDELILTQLPPESCLDTFKSFEIYNRYGTKIYESLEPKIQWNAKSNTDGVYFYVLKYSRNTFQGWIQVLR